MKIDYELVEKIGANCYMICDDGSIGYFRIDGNNVYVHSNETCDTNLIPLSIHEIVKFGVKPIQPKPPVRVEYEKVTFDKASEAVKAWEDGELYTRSSHEDYVKIGTPTGAITYIHDLYRRIEKPVDWQNAVVDYIYGNYNPTNHDALSESLVTAIGSGVDFKYLTQDEFLEMCRIALRANGEL